MFSALGTRFTVKMIVAMCAFIAIIGVIPSGIQIIKQYDGGASVQKKLVHKGCKLWIKAAKTSELVDFDVTILITNDHLMGIIFTNGSIMTKGLDITKGIITTEIIFTTANTSYIASAQGNITNGMEDQKFIVLDNNIYTEKWIWAGVIKVASVMKSSSLLLPSCAPPPSANITHNCSQWQKSWSVTLWCCKHEWKGCELGSPPNITPITNNTNNSNSTQHQQHQQHQQRQQERRLQYTHKSRSVKASPPVVLLLVLVRMAAR